LVLTQPMVPRRKEFLMGDAIISLVSSVAPWLAPLPTAYLVWRSTTIHLEWPTWVASAAALVVECIGLTVTSIALTLYNYNQSRRKSDPGAPFWLAVTLVGVYVLVAVFLTLLMDTIPSLAKYAPLIFPALSLTGVTSLALRADHGRRLAAVAEAKAERRAARVSPLVTPTVTGVTARDRISNLVTSGVTGAAEIAAQTGYSKKTVYKWLKRIS
jgi:hypothetical protein